ncbi:GGDEF domain-containing protein [Salidesulfovibrio onnuriiensis]|uniref:GGDEF domain-containing protein n=1 Tax=Salidesulfovibrio onnuriiensis TaxID=2583823 RepID=UPI0011C923E2|nr:GGDEF domain-containing protein [Salidesulfovibrio onnuriiensis]
MDSGKTLTNLDELKSVLGSFGISSELDWIAVVLFARNLVRDLTVFTDPAKAEMQRAIFAELATKDLSDERYAQIIETLDIFIMNNIATRELEQALTEEKRSAAALLAEMGGLIETIRGTRKHQEVRLEDFQDRTVGVIKESEDRSVIVSKVRGIFKELVSEFQEESQEWEKLASELQRTATFDPLLTELYNRRAFDAALTKAVRRSRETETSLTAFMIDVDHFKSVNDTFGHQVGDEVLKALASIISSQAVQFQGFVARYGGEEIIVMAEGLTEERAFISAEAMRQDVQRYDFRVREDGKFSDLPLKFTVSIGVAMLRPEWGPAELVQAADKAMYEAKQSGRNQVRILRNGTI